MAVNGLINGNMPIPNPRGRVGGSGYQQWDEGVGDPAIAPAQLDAGQLFAQWLEQNPSASPQEIFAAGLNTGLSGGTLPPPVVREGMGFPTGAEEFVPPLDEFGPDVAPIPGMGTPTGPGFSTKTPYNPNLSPYVPPQQGEVVPGQIQPQPPNIDITDILGTPRGP